MWPRQPWRPRPARPAGLRSLLGFELRAGPKLSENFIASFGVEASGTQRQLEGLEIVSAFNSGPACSLMLRSHSLHSATPYIAYGNLMQPGAAVLCDGGFAEC